jgi:hypothetical protein
MLAIVTGNGNGSEGGWRDTPARFQAMQSRSQENNPPASIIFRTLALGVDQVKLHKVGIVRAK